MELIAQGPNIDSRWRRPIVRSIFELGRTTPSFRVPWDSQISRTHIRVELLGSGLKIAKLKDAANPVFYNGKQKQSFLLQPGEHFVIGTTTFTLTDDKAFASLDAPQPISQKTFSPEFLAKVVYRDADRRIDILNRLPEAISNTGNTDDLLIRIVNMLMAGITPANSIGIVRTSDLNSETSTNDSDIEIVKWDRRGFDEGDFQPSGSLIRQALVSEETVLHIWNQNKRESAEYTFDYENDWAFVCPISSLASQGWGIYVAGTNRGGSTTGEKSDEPDLQGDIKFCELIGATLKNLLLVREFERQNSSLRAFFSPVVMDAMAGQDPDEILAPRTCELAVMFCDLKGFSRTSEQMADQLFELLDRVSDSLSIVTGEILNHGGVIGDFQGDSAMGFWGWPIENDDVNDTTTLAAKAAVKIQQLFQRNLKLQSESEHNNFQIGIGIASGKAVAGKIGSLDQVKVTAFGPVVNLASRLEGMTRWTNSGILVDQETAKRIEKSNLPVKPVTRRLAKFLPFGMEKEVSVFQVFDRADIEPRHIVAFESALESFELGNWVDAQKKLTPFSQLDSAAQFLKAFIRQHDAQPPENWDGIIPMNAK